MEKKQRIVILGGGFAGAYCAQALGRSDIRDKVEVVLINRRNYILFYPLLVEAGTGSIESRHAVISIRSFLKSMRFLMADVKSVDFDKKEVVYQMEGGEGPQTLPYDQVIVALGSTSLQPPVPGLKEFGFPMKSMRNALSLRDRVIQLLEIADATSDPERRRNLLHFVVVGANFTGVEVAGEFNSFLRDAVKRYPNLTKEDYKITLVDLNDHILDALGDKDLSAYTLNYMRGQGISVLLKTSVKEIALDRVTMSTGDTAGTQTVIWCAGIAPNRLIKSLSVPVDRRGYILTERDLRIKEKQNAWAAGDCAVVLDADNKPYPATAQLAVKQGQILANNIVRSIQGKPTLPCNLKNLGQIASIGKGTGVGKIMGIKFAGLIASLLYHFIYIGKMPGLGRKMRVGLDWVLDFVFPRDFVEMGFYRTRIGSESDRAEEARKEAEPVSK